MGIIRSWEKSDVALKQKSKYLGMLIDMDLERVFSANLGNPGIRFVMDVAMTFQICGIFAMLCSMVACGSLCFGNSSKYIGHFQ